MPNFFEENREMICAVAQKHRTDEATALNMLVYDMTTGQRYTLGIMSRVKWEDLQEQYRKQPVAELARQRQAYMVRHFGEEEGKRA